MNKISIPARNGGSVRVNDFFKTAKPTSDKNFFVIEETPDYDFDYFKKDNYFLITLQNSDVYTSREKAENELLKVLGISKEDACKLKIDLGVPYGVNPNFANANYGLSFCPNGLPFPKSNNQPASGSEQPLIQNFLNFLKNPLTVAFVAAGVILIGILFYFKR